MKAGLMVKRIKSLLASILIMLTNFFFGYKSWWVSMAFLFILNRPKGYGYSVPEDEHPVNVAIGIILLLIYFGGLIGLDIFYNKKFVKHIISRKGFIVLLVIGFAAGAFLLESLYPGAILNIRDFQ
ncbi:MULTISPECIES: hypothetical protein [Shuttleworthella]|uniref:Uncharacterized protein n=1 Tax=Shuttleworthella satelles DSM 14600 TaxID=626523 RepID=C4G9F4_9FIRM|nr:MULTISPECIES: hypothetical protein [Shuttleworthia]EEP29251.1 hypothetical protein GCWU000342_00607 [Shuttleworthia satelles DSM 14600]